MIALGKLRQQVYTRLAEEYTNKETFKKTFNTIMTVLNENKSLNKVFNIYTDFETRHISSKEIASEFIIEAVNEIKSLMTKDYVSGVKKLSTFVGQVKCNENETTKHLDILVHNHGYETLVERIESKNTLVGILTEPKEIKESTNPVTQSILSSLLVTKFNDKFSVMTESEKEKFKKYTDMNTSEVNDIVTELKTQLRESINELKSNVELKEIVLEVEKKVDESGSDLLSLVKLEQLKESLS